MKCVYKTPAAAYKAPAVPFSPLPKTGSRKKPGIGEDTIVLVCFEYPGKENNTDELILGLSWIIDSAPDTVLLVVGGASDHAELIDWASFLKVEKHVIFAPACSPEELRAYLRIADIFAGASEVGTLRTAASEAAAAGLPLIYRRAPGLAGILSESINAFGYDTLDDFEKAFKGCLNIIDRSGNTSTAAGNCNINTSLLHAFPDKKLRQVIVP